MRIPTATYRLQFNSSFGFLQAGKIIPYLHALGISDIYASPIFKAKTGSMHGYDIVDPNVLNPELGSRKDFSKMTAERHKYKIGWLQDIVPNHMAFSSENKWLMDVLESGSNSRFFNFFDIVWEHPSKVLQGKVMVPVLARLYGKAIGSGKIRLELSQDGLGVCYYEFRLPLSLASYSHFLSHNLDNLKNSNKLKNILVLCDRFDSLSIQPWNNQRDRRVSKAKADLWNLYTTDGPAKIYLENALKYFNGRNTHKNKYRPLLALLNKQLFKLVLWKKAGKRINYRRFFYLNEFIGLREEDYDVFKFTHNLILKLVKNGTFNGLRIDHIDGLFDPTGYLKYLRKKSGDAYIIVEKILEAKEELPDYWPIQGTTGYEFADYVNKLFCCDKNEEAFSRIYKSFTGSENNFNQLLYEKKKFIVLKYMRGDVKYLVHLARKLICADKKNTKESAQNIEDALIEITAAFTIYRTYRNYGKCEETDKRYIEQAIELAGNKRPKLKHTINTIGQYLLYNVSGHRKHLAENAVLDFIMKFQQITGPVMAKGFEDTFLYCYNRLVSLNEVGSSPEQFGITMKTFDKFNKTRAGQWPHSLNATGTHDTKRGEDVRARINILSEIPAQWRTKIKYWSSINKHKKNRLNKTLAPSGNDEYLLYQTLIGALPFCKSEYKAFKKRTKEYFIKAIREAKEHTRWIKPNTEYEKACEQFVDRILTFSAKDEFWKDFTAFQKSVADYAIYNSLSQVLIKMTTPGVPDFYQGCELFDFNLVDPDNRRPVDFEMRIKLLKELKTKESRDISALLGELLDSKEDGRLKMFLIYKALSARKKYRHLFETGRYQPLHIEGCYKKNIIAFARTYRDEEAIVITPRFLTSIITDAHRPPGEDLWKDTRIISPGFSRKLWLNVITGEKIKSTKELYAGDILNKCPVGLIITEK